MDGQSVGAATEKINAVGAHGKTAALAAGRGKGGEGGILKGGLSQADIDAQNRRRALEAARNPGGRGGQWVRGEKGEMEWLGAAQLEAREEERRKRAEALQQARASEKAARVNHEQRVKAEIAAAPKVCRECRECREAGVWTAGCG